MIKNTQYIKTGIIGFVHFDLIPKRNLEVSYLMTECFYPNPSDPVFLLGGAYAFTTNIIEPFLIALEQYSGSVIEIDDIFIADISPDKIWVQDIMMINSYSKEDVYSEDYCFMFNSIALFQCVDVYDIIEFWNKWKATGKSCNLTSALK